MDVIQSEQIKSIVQAILLHGKRVNLVGMKAHKYNRTDIDREFIDELERAGAEVRFDSQDEYATFDTTVVVKPLEGQWRHYDGVTLFMIPEQSDWDFFGAEGLDQYDGYPDIIQWRKKTAQAQRIIHTENWACKPAVLIAKSAEEQVIKDLNGYYMNTVATLHPELIPHWHNICFLYAGANQEWCIDRVPYTDVIEYVEEQLAAGKNKVIFVNSDEAVLPSSVQKCHRVVRHFSDLSPDTWFYVTGSIDGEETYRNYCAHVNDDTLMHIISGYRFESVAKSTVQLEVQPSELCISRKELLEIDSTPRIRLKNFVCFNRMTRWHRVQILSYCLENNLVDDAYYSFDFATADTGYNDRERWNLDNPEHYNFDSGYLKGWMERWPASRAIYNHWHKFPLVLNRTEERENPVQLCTADVKYHKHSYFSVVPETTFHKSLGAEGAPTSMNHTDGVFISEKIYKPIAYKHPFIVASTAGYLTQLRRCGYKTFHPFIDESYDNEVDDNKRMMMICEEISRLCAQTDEQWLEFQANVQDIVEHNLAVFLDGSKSLSTTKINLKEYFK